MKVKKLYYDKPISVYIVGGDSIILLLTVTKPIETSAILNRPYQISRFILKFTYMPHFQPEGDRSGGKNPSMVIKLYIKKCMKLCTVLKLPLPTTISVF